MTTQESFLPEQDLARQLLIFNERNPVVGMETDGALNLLQAVFVPGAVQSVEGADLGVNFYLAQLNGQWLSVLVQAYIAMRGGDAIELLYYTEQGPEVVVATAYVRAGQEGKDIEMFMPSDKLIEGFAVLYARVTRAPSGNISTTLPIRVLYKSTLPAGPDREPDTPSHSALLMPGVPAQISAESLGDVVYVTIQPYPYMRRNDAIHLSWNGIIFVYRIKASEVGGVVRVPLPASIVREAGSGLAVPVVFRVIDEVGNISEKWSERAYAFVQLEDEQDLLDAPVYPDADAQGELDLGALQGRPVLIDVQAVRGLFKAGDSILVAFVGTTKGGQVITHRLAPQTVQTLRTYTFQVPYADALALDGGSGEARYAVLRGGEQLYASLAARVNFRSVVARLPAPEVTSAANGLLDNTLPSATVVIPVLAGASSQSRVQLSWIITSPSGATYTHTQVYPVSANDIGRPISLAVPGVHFNGLTGRLEVSYRFQRDAVSSLVDSAVQVLQVVQQLAEPLPKPTVPLAEPPEGTRLDPLKAQGGATVVLAYPGMLGTDSITLYTEAGDVVTVPGSSAGQVVLPMSSALVGSFIGKYATLRYRMLRNGRTYRSEALRLEVLPLSSSSLPVLVIPQANGTSVLDLSRFSGNAQVTLRPWLFIASGQTYWLEASGVDKAGQVVNVLTLSNKAVTASMVVDGLVEALPRDRLQLLAPRSPLTLKLFVAFDGSDRTGTQAFVPLVVMVEGGGGKDIEYTDFNDGTFQGWMLSGVPPRLVRDFADNRYCLLTSNGNVGSGIKKAFVFERASYQVSVRASGLGKSGLVNVSTRRDSKQIAVGSDWGETSCTFDSIGDTEDLQIWTQPKDFLVTGCALDWVRVTRLP